MMYMKIKTKHHFLLVVTSILHYFYILEVKFICSASHSTNSGIDTNLLVLNNMKNDFSKSKTTPPKSQCIKPKLYNPLIHSLKIKNEIESPSPTFMHNTIICELKECISSSSINLLSTHDIFNLISHLKKCKSMVKWIPSARQLERTLQRISSQLTQTNSWRMSGELHHLQFLALVFFLRLYSIVRSCISFIRSVQSSSNGSHQCSITPYFDNATQLQHFHRMIHVYRESLQRLIRDPKCTSRKETLQQTQRKSKNDSEERFRETLISNFVVNSLSDLKVPHDPYKIFLPWYNQGGHTTMTPAIHISTTESPPLGNFDDIPETKIYPVPFPLTDPSSTHHTSISDSTDYYKLYPLPVNPPPWHPPTNDYHIPSPNVDLHLNFPSSPDDSSSTSSIANRDPVFIEPISVSSIDQLPTNYPIPLENASLSHNPLTVLVGARPPEIIVLQDFTFTEEDPVPPPAGAALPSNGDGSIAADPATAGSAGSGLSGGAAAAAVAAGAGAAGLGALGTAGIVGGAVAGGIGAGAAGAAAGGDAAGAASSSLSGATDGSDAMDLETIFSNFYEIISYVFSSEFLRTIGSTLYSLALPHISFLMTSVSTVFAFFFPWMYPDIVAQFTNFFTSFE